MALKFLILAVCALAVSASYIEPRSGKKASELLAAWR